MLVKRTRKAAMQRQVELAGENLAGLVEAGLLMACADGELTDEEVDTVASVIDGFCDGRVTSRQIRDLMRTALASIEAAGYDGTLEAMAQHLSLPEARELALGCAAAVMVSDGEYAEGSEDEAYYDMADTLEIDRDRADEILDEVVGLYEG